MKATHNLPTTPVSDPMRPSALLRGAVIYLGTYGWTQHEFYDMTADTDGPFPPACTSGAIMTAATGRCLAHGMCTLDGDEDPETIAALRTMRYFADWLDCESAPAEAFPVSSIDVIGDWNDYDGRTRDEVIEILTDAANDWDTTHATGGAR